MEKADYLLTSFNEKVLALQFDKKVRLKCTEVRTASFSILRRQDKLIHPHLSVGTCGNMRRALLSLNT